MKPGEKQVEEAEQRKHSRVVAHNVSGDISNGQAVFRGKIIDFSASGCRILGQPLDFRSDLHTYTAIISTSEHHFKLLVSPRWRREIEHNREVEIGFKVLDSDWDWIEYSERRVQGSA